MKYGFTPIICCLFRVVAALFALSEVSNYFEDAAESSQSRHWRSHPKAITFQSLQWRVQRQRTSTPNQLDHHAMVTLRMGCPKQKRPLAPPGPLVS
jgi:hypothetical protein